MFHRLVSDTSLLWLNLNRRPRLSSLRWSPVRCFGAEIVARLHEMLGDRLPLKIKRVASPDVRMPAAPALAQQLLPNAEKIAAAVRAIMI